MTREESIETIKEKLFAVDIILQLAEEASELSAAAAKWVRIVEGRNPTPVDHWQAWMNLLEEIADAQNCMDCILSTKDRAIVQGMAKGKLIRWADRLQKKEAEDEERNKSAVCTGRRRARNQNGT